MRDGCNGSGLQNDLSYISNRLPKFNRMIKPFAKRSVYGRI